MRFKERFRAVATLAFAAALLWTAAARAQEPSPAPRGNEGFPIGPPANILSFTATPASVQAGQFVTLTWAAVNSVDMSIDQCVGTIPARGSRQVSPAMTTTYTLTAKGRGGNDKHSVTVTVTGSSSAAANSDAVCAEDRDKPIPRMGDHPDLSGIYIGGFGIVPMDKITLKPGAEHFKMTEEETALGPTTQCVPPGVPTATMWPYPLQIVQKPNLVLILYEAYPMFRVIPTDGTPHPDDLDPTWMGNSVGHWEGDTLVVDVTGFNDKTVISGYHHTTAYHVVERYRRTSYGTLSYVATIEDRNVFAAPWRYGGPLLLHPEWDLQEYVCEENNKNYQELLPAKKQ
ncbi:MAG: hypothetical protein LAN36_10535 [Acidobacteriia bacterium]|nr:hypothetical protein [Terriglobia bacterium]